MDKQIGGQFEPSVPHPQSQPERPGLLNLLINLIRILSVVPADSSGWYRRSQSSGEG
jgi:hypothetical protein